jgi:hypothetical protein
MHEWSAEITNDPERDYDVYVELLYRDRYVGRIQRTITGEIVVEVYDKIEAPIPADWLMGVIKRAIAEL